MLRLLMLLFYLTPVVCQATTLRYRSLDTLIDSSDVIVLGRVIGQEGMWQGTRIVTKHEIEISESFYTKAEKIPTEKLFIVTLGGTVGSFSQIIHSSGEISLGDWIVALLRAGHEPSHYVLNGMAQGLWHVAEVINQKPENWQLIGVWQKEAGRQTGVLAERLPPKNLKTLQQRIMEHTHHEAK